MESYLTDYNMRFSLIIGFTRLFKVSISEKVPRKLSSKTFALHFSSTPLVYTIHITNSKTLFY